MNLMVMLLVCVISSLAMLAYKRLTTPVLLKITAWKGNKLVTSTTEFCNGIEAIRFANAEIKTGLYDYIRVADAENGTVYVTVNYKGK